ncbi:hypothetical protein CQ042_07705 [Microbacterium sp. MYb62]|nr:hypothetical protein CQ042_07705 [Microbacterium sp. MYb62]
MFSLFVGRLSTLSSLTSNGNGTDRHHPGISLKKFLAAARDARHDALELRELALPVARPVAPGTQKRQRRGGGDP